MKNKIELLMIACATLVGSARASGGDQIFSYLQASSGLDELRVSMSYLDITGLGGVGGYAGWSATYNLAGSKMDDDDDDGQKNLCEYAVGGNPTNAADTGIATEVSAGQAGGTNWIDYVYPRLTAPDSGIDYRVVQADDIAGGSWSNGVYLETGTAAMGNGFEAVTNRIVTTAPGMFFRLQVSVKQETNVVFSMKSIAGGTNSGTDPDFGAYSLTVESFYMDETEITKAQWDEVYNWAVAHGYGFDRAGYGKASNHPVVAINWFDCVKWCNARSQMEGKTPCYTVGGSVYQTGQSTPDCDFNANGYRLPTSAEWEYAARGGYASHRFPWGDTIAQSDANYSSYWPYDVPYYSYDVNPASGLHPSYEDTSPVGSFSLNGYGLYDMAGNVGEWCWDASDSVRSIRGGSWNTYAHVGRCGSTAWVFAHDASFAYGVRTACR